MEVPETKVSQDNLLEYDDMEVPLENQDSYTNTRPYPCDFCPKRFRKKANLMNHMVTHQTDERPHGCNLCGQRFHKKQELMSHLKCHAYAPTGGGLVDELEDPLATEEENYPAKGRRKKVQTNVPRKRKSTPAANKRMEDAKLDMNKYVLID